MERILIPADKKRIAEAIEPIVALLEDHDADLTLTTKIELALDEALTNVATYAYGPGTGDIEVEYGFDEKTRLLTVLIADEGKAFDPLAKEDPNIALPAKDRQIGGLGIFIVKQAMDEASYRRVGNKNVLTLQKRI